MPSFQNPDGAFFAFGDGIMVVNPLTGTTVQIPQQTRSLYINNGSTLAALTVRLPPAPTSRSADNSVNIGSANGVTALTVQDRFGNAVASASGGSLAGGTTASALIVRYIPTPVNAWVKWK
jgi:hypothetical protein